MKKLFLGAAFCALAACGEKAAETTEAEAVTEAPAVEAAPAMEEPAGRSIDDILAKQSEEAQARYQYRNPKETLEFFGNEPGMKVAEALPGGGWYSKILLPLLGNEGMLYGVDYSLEMWPEFGGFATEEFIESKKSWPATWVADAEEWRDEDSAKLGAFTFGTAPEELYGTLDAVIFVRAMHNLNRFEGSGGYRTQAINDSYNLLKPGGIVGIVQHRAPEDNDDAWADGSAGYLKQSAVISMMEEVGFELVGESEINANENDQPTTEDFVWRLPPTLGNSGEDEELRAKMIAIGESDRMTLKFKKPE